MRKPRTRTKKPPKRVLALPDLEHAKSAVLSRLTSVSAQRTYDHGCQRRCANCGTMRWSPCCLAAAFAGRSC